MERQKVHASELEQPWTAEKVAEFADDFVSDSYHELLGIGGRVMANNGLGHWVYRAGYGASTLWADPEAQNRTIVVWYDGSTS